MPTFVHGKDAVVYQDANDLTGYLKSVSASAEVETAEATTFADDDKVYVAGLTDATVSAEGLFDSTFDGNVRDMLALGGTKSIWSVYPMGDAVPNPGRGYHLDITKAEQTADVGDVVGITLEGQSSVGTNAIISHHALAERTATGTATVVDGTAATTGGGVGYVHATSAAGSAVMVVQHSADNITYADFVNLGTVTAAARVFRTQTTGTVNRYTRLTYTIAAGTATFVAGFARN